jgi:hypothetical protein
MSFYPIVKHKANTINETYIDYEAYKEEGLLHMLLKSRRDLGVKSKGYSRRGGALQIIS